MNKKRIIIGVIVLVAVATVIYLRNKTTTTQPTYQTGIATQDTLVTTVTASGNITSGNNVNITTNASGTIDKVFVKNGDKVVMGQKIATLILDQTALQKQAQAWASYLSAQNQLASTKANLNQLQSASFAANQKFLNDAAARGLVESDPTYIQEYATWKQAEANYINQSGQIAAAQVSLTSAWYSYQQISSTITAPSSGIVTNLIVASGSLISGSSSSSSNTSTNPQILGSIAKTSQTMAQVSLSEIDAAKVKAGQKVTITMDAFPTKSFTGTVLLINTNGSVSSGVTTYPVTILFDTSTDTIYPNMAVNVKIITNIKDNAILVPSAAVLTSNGATAVRELVKGELVLVQATVGDSSDTMTEVLAGVNVGDTMVTSITTSTAKTTTTGTSPFSGLNRTGAGGGNVIRMQGR